MSGLEDRLLLEGEKMDADLAARVVAGTKVRTMAGAGSLELTLDDHDFRILESGIFAKAGKPTARQQKIEEFDQAAWARYGRSTIALDGWVLRLAGTAPSLSAGSRTMGITAEDEAATLMRLSTAPVKASRNAQGNPGSHTRAQFLFMLFLMATKAGTGSSYGYEFFSPERSVRERVKQPDVPERNKGIAKHAKVTVKGVPADTEQRRNMETVLGVADELRAPEIATLALLAACITESTFRNLPGGDSSSVGILQLLDIHLGGSTSTDGGRRDVALCAKLFLTAGFAGAGGAIKVATGHPDYSVAQIAQAVQASGTSDGSNYAPYVAEAQKILDAYGGTYKAQVTEERYEYEAGGKHRGVVHNYWDDAGDIAAEVRWRLFADLNVLYYVSDEWLFQRQPALLIDRGLMTSGALDFSANADVGMPIAEAKVGGLLKGFGAPPGATIELDQLGPYNGRWLLWESRQDLFSDRVDLTLRRPAPALKEPANDVRVRKLTSGDPGPLDAGSVRGLTPKRVIDQFILPIGRAHGLKTPSGSDLTPENVAAANAAHGHTVTGSTSDHEGPPDVAWAVDMGNGVTTPEEDDVADIVARMFGIPVSRQPNDRYPFNHNVTIGGFRFQLGYRTYVGGDHYNHVHVGCRKV